MVSEVLEAPNAPIQDGRPADGSDVDNLKLDLHPHYKEHSSHKQQDVISVSSADEEYNDDGLCYDNRIALHTGNGEEGNGPTVFVSDSSGVHVGTKNYYQGPVTIKKIVYAGNGGDAPDVPSIKFNDAMINGKYETDKYADDHSRNCAIGDKGTEKLSMQSGKVNNNFKSQLRNLKYNKPLLVSMIVFAIAMATIFSSLYFFLPGNNFKHTPTDSDELLSRPSDEPPQDPIELPPQRVRIITRREWLAQPPSPAANILTVPVSIVIIWHTATYNCTSQALCTNQVKLIQQFHMQSQSWRDIAYNFLVGGDGYVYEGRGWNAEGSHTKYYNNISIGIAFIGTFTSFLPPKRQMDAARNLIALGVTEKYITPNYNLFGSRQLSSTESPGEMLYNEIKTWPHWSKKKP